MDRTQAAPLGRGKSRGGRPPVGDRRRLPIGIRFSGAEREALRLRAREAGRTVADFVRRAALGARIVAPVPAVNIEISRDLGKVAGLVNQMVKEAHAGRIIPAAEILPRLDEFAQAVRLLRLELVAGAEEEGTDQ